MAMLNAGNGNDGNITISADKNINTDILAGGRSYADGVVYRINAITNNTVTIVDASPLGIAQNDEILLINLKGTSDSNYDNAGNYEFLIVDSIVGDTITFKTDKTKNYGDNGGDSNVQSHHVIIQRVPNYQEVTIQNTFTLTCNQWSLAAPVGIIVFRVKGTLTNNGTISVLGKGFKSPSSAGTDVGYQGQSIGQNAIRAEVASVGGGAGGEETKNEADGSSYGTVGDTGAGGGSPGSVYGEETLAKLFLGSGGAGIGDWGNGGAAGGIIFITARTLNNDGELNSDGVAGTGTTAGGGWGGTGGSIRIEAGTLLLGDGTLSAIGLDGSGHGRNAIYYNNTTELVSGSPTPYTDGTLEIPIAYSIAGTLNKDAEIAIYDITTRQLIKKEAKSAGNYEIELVDSDVVDVVARNVSGETQTFGGVLPTPL